MFTNWDKYFFDICQAISLKSPCLSRQIGAILVRDKSIVSTGYNGPPRGYPHCNTYIEEELTDLQKASGLEPKHILKCPRQIQGFKSGEGLHLCPAAHAETNCITNAARLGVSTIDTTLYMNTLIPCKECAKLIVNAGISEIVILNLRSYDQLSTSIFTYSKIKLRCFDI